MCSPSFKKTDFLKTSELNGPMEELGGSGEEGSGGEQCPPNMYKAPCGPACPQDCTKVRSAFQATTYLLYILASRSSAAVFFRGVRYFRCHDGAERAHAAGRVYAVQEGGLHLKMACY